MSLILVRGLPGSGKSTIGQSLNKALGYIHLEADMYHMKDGEYQFNPAKIKEAHLWCQLETIKALADHNFVVVTNTFTTLRELEPYLMMAKSLQKSVRIVDAKGTWENIHNVPEEVMQRMRDRWEDLDRYSTGAVHAS